MPLFVYSTHPKASFYQQLAQDICGGIIAIAPDKKDWDNPDIHDYLEHYLGGSAHFSTENRLRMIHLTQRMPCSHKSAFYEVTPVHAEGSVATQMMMIMAESPVKKYQTIVRVAAGIL